MNTNRIKQRNMNQSDHMDIDMSNIEARLHPGLYKARKQTASSSPRSSFSRGCIRKQKHVRFSESSTLIITQPKTVAEMSETWYSKQEVAEFKRDVKESSKNQWGTPQAQAMRYIGHCVQSGESQAELAIDNVERIRGLEHLISPEVCRVLLQRRRATIGRVLQEQRRQEEEGSFDAEKIATLSLVNSEFAREWRKRIMHL